MKATLEFTLPDDAHEHRTAINAPDVAAVVSFADQQMRNWAKYGHEFKTVEQAITECRALLADAVKIIEP